MDNLSPINSDLDVPTKKYVDDVDAARAPGSTATVNNALKGYLQDAIVPLNSEAPGFRNFFLGHMDNILVAWAGSGYVITTSVTGTATVVGGVDSLITYGTSSYMTLDPGATPAGSTATIEIIRGTAPALPTFSHAYYTPFVRMRMAYPAVPAQIEWRGNDGTWGTAYPNAVPNALGGSVYLANEQTLHGTANYPPSGIRVTFDLSSRPAGTGGRVYVSEFGIYHESQPFGLYTFSQKTHNHSGVYDPAGSAAAAEAAAKAASVAKAGDSMTGNLDMGTEAKVVNHPLPDDPGDVASKEYVDSQGGGSHSSLANLENDDHGQYAPIHVIDAADPDPEEYQRPGQIVVRKGVAVNEGLEFLQKQGGQMTGPLFLQGDPASDMEAVPRFYVDPTGNGDTGWVAWTVTGASFAGYPGQWWPYYRLRNGWMQFRGLIYPTATWTAGANAGIAPYLPAQVGASGFNGHHFVTLMGAGSSNAVRVKSNDGTVDVVLAGTVTGTANWISLDTVGYWID